MSMNAPRHAKASVCHVPSGGANQGRGSTLYDYGGHQIDGASLRGKPLHRIITLLLPTAEPSPQLQLTGPATTVARRMSVCAVAEAVLITTDQFLPERTTTP
eukprot:4325215-Pleurochrysis_carterae.AAC.1